MRTGSDRNAALSLKCGTAPYMAPEMNIEAACYTNLVDVWSVGIVMYRLLRDGKAPFTLEELQLLAREPDTSVDLRFRKINCSFNCLHLLTSLLAPDPFKRCPSYMAIEHPFITGDPNSLPPLMFSELERARETRHRISMVVSRQPGLPVPSRHEKSVAREKKVQAEPKLQQRQRPFGEQRSEREEELQNIGD